MKEFAYHQWSIADTARHFEVDANIGLSERVARLRLTQQGQNSLEELKETSLWTILLRQFANFFIILLFVAAVISYFVDGPTQSIILLAIIILNTGLGFFQEFKAEKSLSELKKAFSSKSKVLRDGKIRVIDNREIVTGDAIVFEAGDRIPADLRIIEESSLRTNESSLTGESIPVGKTVAVLPLKTPLGDRKNMAYGSTCVVAGHGKGIVVATATDTEFGKIAKMIETPQEKTPLEKQVLYLGKILTIIALLLGGVIFGLGYLRDFDVLELLTFTIALLVAVVPESLPTAITLSLAIGVSRMARKKSIVRRMAVIETLGTVNIIATDKTGTLTENNIVADKVFLFNKKEFVEVSVSEKNKNHMAAIDLFAHGIVCSNIDVAHRKELVGDPVEIAIVEGANLLDKLSLYLANKYERLLEIPFDSDKKYMAVLINSGGEKSLIAKGAVEKIVDFCDLSNKDKELILAKARNLSMGGYKVIALADKHLGAINSGMLKGMQFQGMFALVDEPSAGIREALEEAIKAGIRPIMLTGDHPETARFIANKVGFSVSDDEILTKEDLEKLDVKALKKIIPRIKIFARIAPEDKIMVVRLLQELGFTVAMTGDGVNDAPALKKADVGVAMGIKGTDVAKEAADIILLDDKYKTIIAAVKYGRTIYDNIKNVVVFLISGNLVEMVLVGISFLFVLPVPFTTLQILWVNLVTDSLPALAMAFEEPSSKVMAQEPRSSKASSMHESLVYSLTLAVASFFLGLLLYLWGLNYSIAHARTMVFCYVVFLELVYAISIRSKKRIWESPKSFVENKFLIVSVLLSMVLQLLLFLKPLRGIFQIELLSSGEFITLGLVIVLTFFCAEGIRAHIDKKLRD